MRAVSISPYMGFSNAGSVADAVVAWTGLSCGIAGSGDLCNSSVVGAPMSFVDGRCVRVFGAVHPVVVLNFGRYQYVISFEMFWID